jgi:hypothetical protein
MTIGAARYFTTVGLQSTYLLFVMGAVTVSGVALLVSDSSKGAEAIGPLALVQMFAAASGFSVPARRGHFDLLLTGGATRSSIALTHLALSVVPGLVMWLVMGIVEMVSAATLAPKAFASGTIALFMLVSGPAWALTIGFPRLSGAIGWLLAMALWRAAGFDDQGAFSNVLCPFVLIGRPLVGDLANTAVAAVLVSTCLPIAAVMWIVRMDVPLESAQ